MKALKLTAIVVFLAAAAFWAAIPAHVGCGSAGSGMSGADSDYSWEDSGSYPHGGRGWEKDSYSASDVSYDIPEPEEEFDLDFKAPQASEHYVYIAATARDSLVRIDAQTLTIRLIPVGGRPTRVATLPKGDVALVINSGTQDFSIVRSKETSDDVQTVDMLPYVNTISVSPDGKYAIVYYNQLNAGTGEPVGDFQTVAVVALKGEDVTVSFVSTGFHPTAVYFNAAKSIAYLVTDDGVSIIDLAATQDGDITDIVALTDNPLDDPTMREVVVTADGKYAVVRNLASPEIGVVEMASGKIRSVPIEGLPTDLDLIPGKNTVLTVLREQKKAYVIDLAKVIALPEEGPDFTQAVDVVDITGSSAGAAIVASDGTTAVLYTTVGGVKSVAVMSLTHKPYAWKAYPVQKGVVGVALSNQGLTATVMHEQESYAPTDTEVEQTIAATEGFTLFNLESGYRKLIQTDHRWSSYLFVSDKDGKDQKAYILTPDPLDQSHYVLSVDLVTYIADPIPLASWPESLVFVPDSRKVAVAQQHENGRISFIDVDSDEIWSVTGYELNGLIN